MTKSNVARVLYLLIKELKINVTQKSIDSELAIHPLSNALVAISDVLNHWCIPNAAYQLTFEELIDNEVETPFIAFIKIDGRTDFTVVKEVNNEFVKLSNNKWDNKKHSLKEFSNLFDGTILIAEPNELSGEKDFFQKSLKYFFENVRSPIAITCLLVFFIFSLAYHSNYFLAIDTHLALLTGVKILAVATTILLLIQSIDVNNPIFQKICGADSNLNCNAILSSKAAKITDDLSWSDVGFFYFSGTFIALLLNADQQSVIRILAILNVLCLPYTFYSIYYQWKIAKKWCVFCCTIQALLWVEFILFFPTFRLETSSPSGIQWVNLAMEIPLPAIVWMLILRPLLLNKRLLAAATDQLDKFRYNKGLFKRILNEEIKVSLPEVNDTIILGDVAAKHTITLVSNLFCESCGQAHEILANWLNSRKDIRLQIVFPIYNIDTDVRTRVAQHFLALRSNNDDAMMHKAFHQWYDMTEKIYKTWSDKFIAKEIGDYFKEMSKQKEWCEMVGISGTPVIFFDGHRFPNAYKIEDVKYFI